MSVSYWYIFFDIVVKRVRSVSWSSICIRKQPSVNYAFVENHHLFYYIPLLDFSQWFIWNSLTRVFINAMNDLVWKIEHFCWFLLLYTYSNLFLFNNHFYLNNKKGLVTLFLWVFCFSLFLGFGGFVFLLSMPSCEPSGNRVQASLRSQTGECLPHLLGSTHDDAGWDEGQVVQEPGIAPPECWLEW